MTEDFEGLFYPDSIAVIGAPSDEEEAQFLQYLTDMGFGGSIYPVNPNADNILGFEVYDDVRDVPEPVDLAIVKVPRTIVPGVIEGCSERGVSFAHIFTGGFGESTDQLGDDLDAELRSAIADSNLRVIGPNCVGIFSPGGRVPFIDKLSPEVGPVGIVSQSGGLATDVCRNGQQHGLRFSKVATVGNMVDVNHVEMLEYLYEDDETEIVVAYLEGVQSSAEGRELFELFDEHAREKPTLVLKGGRTATGARAASSHTGALAGDYNVWRGIFEQTGVIEVDTFDELVDTAVAAMYWDELGDDGVGLVGHGGGLSVTAVDKAASLDLEIPELGEESVGSFASLGIATEIASIGNPIDVPDILAGGDDLDETRELVTRIIQIPSRDESIGTLLLYLNIQNIQGYGIGPEFFEAVLDGVVAAERTLDDVEFGVVLRSNEEPDVFDMFHAGRKRLLDVGIPVFNGLNGSLQAISNLRRASVSGSVETPPPR